MPRSRSEKTTLNAFEQRLVRAHGWAPGLYLFACQDCDEATNERRRRGELGTSARGATRCREHALEAALKLALARGDVLAEQITDAKAIAKERIR